MRVSHHSFTPTTRAKAQKTIEMVKEIKRVREIERKSNEGTESRTENFNDHRFKFRRHTHATVAMFMISYTVLYILKNNTLDCM